MITEKCFNERIGLTGVVSAFLLIKSSLHLVPLQWTLVILIGAAGRRYNGALVLRLVVLGIVPLGDNCAFRELKPMKSTSSLLNVRGKKCRGRLRFAWRSEKNGR